MGLGRAASASRGTECCRHPWGPPPPPINYFGYTQQPVWDPGYNQWGFLVLRGLDSAARLTSKPDGRLREIPGRGGSIALE